MFGSLGFNIKVVFPSLVLFPLQQAYCVYYHCDATLGKGGVAVFLRFALSVLTRSASFFDDQSVRASVRRRARFFSV